MYFKVGKIFLVNNQKKMLQNDVLYNFTEITKPSRRIFRNVCTLIFWTQTELTLRMWDIQDEVAREAN